MNQGSGEGRALRRTEAAVFDDSRPIFLQLADRLADEILRGLYGEDEQVPSTNELAAHLRINPATAGKALTALVERGILIKKRGIGMFVAPGAPRALAEQRNRVFIERYVRPLIAESRTLGLGDAELLGLVGEQLGVDHQPSTKEPTS